MNETDAGDYAIGQSHPVAAAAVVERSKQPTQTFSAPLKLQPFLLLFKNAKGAAAADLIVKATAAPGVYVFGELLQLPALQALQSQPQFANQINLINLFAYGIWTDYTANPTKFPTLTKQQETKLKQLTIITLARENRIIPYAILLNSLDIATVPALEDLIIGAFYGGLMSGKMDQRAKRLEVISCIGRDVQPNTPSSSTASASASIAAPIDVAQSMDLDNTASSSTLPPIVAPSVPSKRLPEGSAHTLSSLTSSLQNWQSTITSLLQSLDFHIAQISSNAINQLSIDAIYTEEVQKTLADVSKPSTSAGKSVEKSTEKGSGDFFRLTGGGGGGAGAGIAGGIEASPGMGSIDTAVPSSAFGNFPTNSATAATDSIPEEEGGEMEIDPVGKGTSARKTKRGRI